ncbi:TPA: glycosyltransferase [Serratia fonticola]|nr:glycosyltransferase [Serratia fonticola]
MKKLVHIKVSDKGWILEKLASEISSRLPYVSYGLEEDRNANIQYYMTYGCRKERVSPIELALFTHKEDVASAAEKFDLVASDVDFCIAQSLKTEDIVKGLGVSAVKTISPGVDLEKYSPIVKIGVVGRTYHTGRKGEKLVAQVMDIPGIEWHFTGDGWPGPAQHIEEDKLPEFYRSLDYILVPALIEGGPMCVLEALASGCKVIASPVGWVPQFPHIEFNLGDVDDLRRVLLSVVEEKAVLRRSVANYTWQAWSEQHHELFCQLLEYDPLLTMVKTDIHQSPILNQKFKALVAVHGQEMTSSLGGPSVRAPKTVAALQNIGLDADFISGRNFKAKDFDVVHALNVWHPNECECLLRQVEKNGVPAVFSPIFLDLSELGFYNQRVKQILSTCHDQKLVANELFNLRKEIEVHRNKPMAEKEPLPHYFNHVRRLTSFSSHLILLSEHENSLLKQIGVDHPSVSIVKNPVDAKVFSAGNPELFRQHIGIKDYVLCVGRIESRKNQALLALALRDTGLPLVLIGHEADAEYAELIRKWGGDKVIFAGRVESNSPMLASAFAGARVFCLASWSEGAPLVALEAAASGCNMVLSNRSSEKEYFGDLARYVDPVNLDEIRNHIQNAWNEPEKIRVERAQKLKELMRTQHSWEHYASLTRDAYTTAIQHSIKSSGSQVSSVSDINKKRIYVDLTTVAHHNGPPTGITRVELCLAESLHNKLGNEIHYVVWNSHHRKFTEVNHSVVVDGTIKMYSEKDSAAFTESCVATDLTFKENDVLFVFGSAWIRNLNYIKSLKTLKLISGVAIITAIYDVIEYKLRFMFTSERRDQFSLNCREMIKISDKILSCSEQTKNDIIEFCLENSTPLCPISVFRLGDEAFSLYTELEGEDVIQLPQSLENVNGFVLYVSTLNIRKNHMQILMLWRSLVKKYGEKVPTLVLVGSVGWGGEEVVDLINSDPHLVDKVILLHDIHDSSLEWLYKNCMFTVYPSRYEGWGLPVAESLRYGKFCLASDAGSLPEVGPGFAEYIDPLDSIAWFTALETYCFDDALLSAKTEIVSGFRPTTWLSTAQQVLDVSNDVLMTERIASLSVGNTLSFASQPQPGELNSSDYLLTGWSNPEVSGTWTIGNESLFGFQVDQGSKTPLSLRISAFGFSPDDSAINVSVLVNGMLSGKFEVVGLPNEMVVTIPSSQLIKGNNVIITLKIDNPKSPSDFGLGDVRILGLHVYSVSLVDSSYRRIVSNISPSKLSNISLRILKRLPYSRQVKMVLKRIRDF